MNKQQELCFCNEPCFYFIKMKRTNSGGSLLKCIVNKCSKNSKKSVCEYVSEKVLEQEEMPEVVDKLEETNTKVYQTEIEKIKSEILETIELYKLQENHNTNSDNSKAKIIAYCYRINIMAVGLCKNNVDYLKGKVQDQSFNALPTKQTRVIKNIELISSTDYPFLKVKNIKKSEKKINKTKENTKKLSTFIRKFDFTGTEDTDPLNQYNTINEDQEVDPGDAEQDEENEEEIELTDEIEEEDVISEPESDDGGDYADYD